MVWCDDAVRCGSVNHSKKFFVGLKKVVAVEQHMLLPLKKEHKARRQRVRDDKKVKCSLKDFFMMTRQMYEFFTTTTFSATTTTIIMIIIILCR